MLGCGFAIRECRCKTSSALTLVVEIKMAEVAAASPTPNGKSLISDRFRSLRVRYRRGARQTQPIRSLLGMLVVSPARTDGGSFGPSFSYRSAGRLQSRYRRSGACVHKAVARFQSLRRLLRHHYRSTYVFICQHCEAHLLFRPSPVQPACRRTCSRGPLRQSQSRRVVDRALRCEKARP